jgi:hypothetical protein
MATRDADALLPLKPVVFQVLLSLIDGERHGYAIVQDIAQRTSARLQMEPGNLYRTLRYADEGLIEGPAGGPRRMPTTSGAATTGSRVSAAPSHRPKPHGSRSSSPMRARANCSRDARDAVAHGGGAGLCASVVPVPRRIPRSLRTRPGRSLPR